MARQRMSATVLDKNINNKTEEEPVENIVVAKKTATAQPNVMKKNVSKPTVVQEYEDESFFVMNITPNLVQINDLASMTCEPFKPINLSHLDEKYRRNSQDLRKLLQYGILKRITIDESDKYNNILHQKSQREALEAQKEQQRILVQSQNGNNMEADYIELNRDYNKNTEKVSTAGYVNDPQSYANALRVAQDMAASRGEEFDPIAFASQMQKNPKLFQELSFKGASAASGDVRRGKAYVARPGDDYGGGEPSYEQLYNFNRDGNIGKDYAVSQSYHGGAGEFLDITAED